MHHRGRYVLLLIGLLLAAVLVLTSDARYTLLSNGWPGATTQLPSPL